MSGASTAALAAPRAAPVAATRPHTLSQSRKTTATTATTKHSQQEPVLHQPPITKFLDASRSRTPVLLRKAGTGVGALPKSKAATTTATTATTTQEPPTNDTLNSKTRSADATTRWPPQRSLFPSPSVVATLNAAAQTAVKPSTPRGLKRPKSVSPRKPGKSSTVKKALASEDGETGVARPEKRLRLDGSSTQIPLLLTPKTHSKGKQLSDQGEAIITTPHEASLVLQEPVEQEQPKRPVPATSTPVKTKSIDPSVTPLALRKRLFDDVNLKNVDAHLKELLTEISPQPRSKAVPTRTEFRSPRPLGPPTPAPTQPHRPLPIDGVTLPLPASYELLDAHFTALEATLSFLAARDQPATFHRIQPAVEVATARAFEWRHLEQIAEVLPDAYRFVGCRALDRERSWVESVCVEVVDHEGGRGASEGEEGSSDDSKADNDGGARTLVDSALPSGTLVFRPWGMQLVRRREEFRRRLVARVKAAHKAFLLSRGILHKDNSDCILAKWHPDFDLATVPDIPRRKIPRGPVAPFTNKAKDVPPKFSVASDSKNVDCNENAENPTISVAAEGPTIAADAKTANINSDSTSSKQDPTKPDAPPLEKPLSRAAAILQRIRDKEKAAAESQMYKPRYDAATIKRRAMLSRIYQVGLGLTCLFSSRKKSVLPLQDVGDYIQTAVSTPLSHLEACDHIRLLAEIYPDWCTLVQTNSGAVVRLEEPKDVDPLATLKKRVGTLLVGGPSSSGT